MATRLPNYQMRDGRTRLGQSYFNPIWADLDNRLDTLERIKIDWNAQVAQLRELGLQRIDDYIRPLTDEVDQLLQQAKDETDGLAQALVDEHINPLVEQVEQILQQAQRDTDTLAQALVDEQLAPILAQAQQLKNDIQGIKNAASQDADTIAQALSDINWEQQLTELGSYINEAVSQKRDISNTSFPRYDLTSSAPTASTITLDFAAQQVFRIAVTETKTIEFSNVPAADRALTAVLHLFDASLSSRIINWPVEIEWDEGGAPAIGSTFARVLLLWDGDSWTGSVKEREV